jgi:Domain of unknown function (DUF4347)/FG-GAP-like repeat/FG-GAP repeat
MTLSTAVIDHALNVPIGPTLTSPVLSPLTVAGAARPTASGAALLFVDADVSDYQALVAGAQPGTEVYVLDRTQDAIGQITHALLGRSGISAINILSHGADGELGFASGALNLTNLPGYAGELQAWRAALATGADILLYGCNVAADGVGQSLVNRMAELTGADVAASSNLTGSAALGGDWTLEYQTGVIQAAALVVSGYGSVLATFDVTNTDDSGAGSLRQAIESANTAGGDNTIDFTGPTFTDATPDTITLTSGKLSITSNVTITGTSANLLTVSGNQTFIVFNIASGSTVVMSGLTITNGNSSGYGGGIYNDGTLSLSNSILSGNSASYNGGGIYNNGRLTLNSSTLSGNSAPGGGGIYNDRDSTLTLSNSTLSGNLAPSGMFGGGGILNFGGTVSLSNSILSGNSAGSLGGGIYNYGPLTLSVLNCTLSGNSAYGGGGGISNYGTLSLSNSTLSDNSVTSPYGSGGGIGNYSGMVELRDSTLSGNSAIYGGGVYNEETLILSNTTLSGNSASKDGGGISSITRTMGSLVSSIIATTTINNSTISGNSATGGGGIYNYGTLTLRSSTLSGNSASTSGGIYNSPSTAFLATLATATNTLFADSSLSGFTPDVTNLVGTAAALGLDPVLRNNGGPTRTHGLLPGSIALDTATGPNATSTDQRGVSAIGIRDIGAFEYQMITLSQQCDFNDDGKADILWHNQITGETSIQLMDGGAQIGLARLPIMDPLWSIERVADFGGTGQGSILWRNTTTKQVAIWQMKGTALDHSDYLINEGIEWQVVGTGDFNGDGKADILWRNTDTGKNGVWLIDGTQLLATYYINTLADQNWKVTGIGDFNGDGQADIVWNNQVTSQSALWQLDGTATFGTANHLDGTATVVSANYLKPTGSDWSVVAVADFNSDGKADLFWRNTATGRNAVWLMNSAAIVADVYISSVPDQNWHVAGVGNFYGKGQVDVIWRNTSTGENASWTLNGTEVLAQNYIVNTGALDTSDLNWKMIA